MCLWPLCFMVTGQEFCARGRNSLETSAAVLCSASRPQVKGLLTGAANFVLLLKANTHTGATQYTCISGQAHIAGHANTSAQWVLVRGLEWGVVHFGFNCVVLCISPGLIMSLYGAWVDEDACMKQRQRAFSGQMRRWRASSAWALLFCLMWSGRGLLLLHHSGWSLLVLNKGFS